MLSDEDLQGQVLTFLAASFSYERQLEGPDGVWAVFHRRETEAKAKLRPRVIRRWVLVPLAWVFEEKGSGSLVLGQGGHRPPSGLSQGPVASEEALPLPGTSFEEQGIPFHTVRFPSGDELYVPEGHQGTWVQRENLARLGLPSPRED
jgi:hypothetical protein